jgi:arylsulfatase
VHEGGISTPLIAHWPAGFAAKNQLRHQPTHLIDLMATCVDLSGASYPATFNGEPIRPPEGRSLAPVFADKPLDREALYWEHEGNRAVRMGDWKLVAKGRKGTWELYDVARDRSELNDLAAAHPELVQKLAGMWLRKAEATQVIPYPP